MLLLSHAKRQKRFMETRCMATPNIQYLYKVGMLHLIGSSLS